MLSSSPPRLQRTKLRLWKIVLAILLTILFGWLAWNFSLHVYAVDEAITGDPADCSPALRFAVIGDFGEAGEPESDVAALVGGWDVDLVVTVGDNNYPDGEASTIDENIGQYYQAFIYPYRGAYGPGAQENRFFPALGNHDWNTGTIEAYLDYFELPGNERYYEFQDGPVHFYVLDSDPLEPDGRSWDSLQANWLEERLKASAEPWKLVFLHHSPFASSLRHGGDREMQWPYASWGVDVVITGHSHLYERLHRDGIPIFVNGLGGRWTGISPIHHFFLPIRGSKVRYNRDYGAMLATADETCINFSFYNRTGVLIDSLTLTKD